jgi:hypothetical protein
MPVRVQATARTSGLALGATLAIPKPVQLPAAKCNVDMTVNCGSVTAKLSAEPLIVSTPVPDALPPMQESVAALIVCR